MPVYVALLRAVNVGGTGTLSMADLRTLCAGLGLRNVRTYIQSGNVLFSSRDSEAALVQTLHQAIIAQMGKPVGVMIRTAAELRAAVGANPYPKAKPSQVGVIFLPNSPPAGCLAEAEIPGREQVQIIGREVFVHYPDGMGRSRLKVPFAADGTTRNFNTVSKLLDLAEAMPP